MNEIMQNIVSRRSIRAYRPDRVPEDMMQEILKACAFAPSAGGRQSPIAVVCENSEINEELGRINFRNLVAIMDKRPPADPKAPSQEKAPPAMDLTERSAFHGAPAVITLFAPKDWYNFTIDCAAAAENIMLAAWSLGLGSCMIARAEETFASDRGREIKCQWGLDDSLEAKIHVVVGFPEGKIPDARERKDGHVVRVR